MYGPLQNAPGQGHWGRGWAIEDVDATLSSSHVSVHECGNRSGLPLWGSTRRMQSPLLQEMVQGRTSPVHADELHSSGFLTVSTAERTTSPASGREKDSFGYLDLLNGLPSMQSHATLACEGTDADQAWESENVLTQTLLRDSGSSGEPKDQKAMVNYAILLHGYHGELTKAAVVLEEAIALKPDSVDALNAYGAVLHDVHERARPMLDKSEMDFIFDRGIKWTGRESQHPNCYDALTKKQHKLTPVAMKGCIQLGKRLQRFENKIAAEQLAARGREKFGG